MCITESVAIGLAIAGLAAGRFVGTVGTTLAGLRTSLKSVGPLNLLSVVYEAGPCGYGLVRERRACGYACEVIVPSKLPQRPGDRVKTERRDAVRLAELARARVDAVRARLRARQRLKALLLRHGHRYTGRSSWTQAHERYLATVTFAHAA